MRQRDLQETQTLLQQELVAQQDTQGMFKSLLDACVWAMVGT